MEEIEAEIQEKVIEKLPETAPPQPELKPVKEKKPRSEAQKAAFEKARLKRAENLKKKQEGLVEDKPPLLPVSVSVIEDKPPPKKRGRPRGSTKAKQLEKPRLPEPVNNPVYQPVNHNIPVANNLPQNYYHYDPRAFPPPQPQPAPVNNYYYYGAPPNDSPPAARPKPILKKQPIFESSSESSEEEQYYGNPEYIQDTYQPPEPKLQFRFA